MSSDVNAAADDVVLSVRGISKCFEMYEKPVHRLFQTLCAGRRKFYKEFWALRDINFDVHKGECVGIIGRNGAGKSTLLQVITGTLAPTTGEVKLKGRVAALLELGSGFNPEFTGRENVYLNGSILGLSKAEIDAKYDEILAFAEIGEFIDQPVKTYSSGMMVRLAFAVNVFVDPSILIVDEALAVGDAFFQQKCFQRLRELKKKGVTLLFVSHDIGTVRAMCDSAVLLKRGHLMQHGPADDVCDAYWNDVVREVSTAAQASKGGGTQTKKASTPAQSYREDKEMASRISNRSGNLMLEFTAIDAFDALDRPARTVARGDRIRVSASFRANRDIPEGAVFAFSCNTMLAEHVAFQNFAGEGFRLPAMKAGEHHVVTFEFVNPFLRAKLFYNFSLQPKGAGAEFYDHVFSALMIESILTPRQMEDEVSGLVPLPVEYVRLS